MLKLNTAILSHVSFIFYLRQWCAQMNCRQADFPRKFPSLFSPLFFMNNFMMLLMLFLLLLLCSFEVVYFKSLCKQITSSITHPHFTNYELRLLVSMLRKKKSRMIFSPLLLKIIFVLAKEETQ